MAGRLRRFDIGSIIRVTVKENGTAFDASAASGKTMKLQKPSGAVLEVPAKFQSDGKDGVVTYTTAENDLSESGPWIGQVFLDFTATQKWHTDTFSFSVANNVS